MGQDELLRRELFELVNRGVVNYGSAGKLAKVARVSEAVVEKILRGKWKSRPLSSAKLRLVCAGLQAETGEVQNHE